MSHSSSGQQGTICITSADDIHQNYCFRAFRIGIERENQAKDHGVYVLGFAAVIALAIIK